MKRVDRLMPRLALAGVALIGGMAALSFFVPPAVAAVTVVQRSAYDHGYTLDNENCVVFASPRPPDRRYALTRQTEQQLRELVWESARRQQASAAFRPDPAFGPEHLYQRIVDNLAPYVTFAQRHSRRARPRSAAQVDAALRQSAAAPPRKTLSPRTLLRLLNIEFLVSALPRTTLVVTAVRHELGNGYRRLVLLFDTDAVGVFEVQLLLPLTAPQPYPVVIGLHGHGQKAAVFQEKYFAESIVRSGIAVIMPSFRAMGFSQDEFVVSAQLLREGFTLLGLRVYETLLVMAYLAERDDIDSNALMLLAHSGGSSVAALLRFIRPALNPVIIDHRSPFREISPRVKFYDEIVPQLVPYRNVIFSADDRRLHCFAYDYPEPSGKAVLRLLRQALAR